jgi:lipoate-protein ligase A
MIVCRLLPYAVADGPHNMAADEVLLEAACAGVASLRFYGWYEPTLSLGYFQSHRVRREDPRLAGLPYVRRPSGGMALVHHHEITYALALPAGPPWLGREPWLRRMHRIIAAALDKLGAAVRPAGPADEGRAGPLCFHHFTAGDLLLGGAKVVGSAQRQVRSKGRAALMQHGGILLAQSPFTPDLPGIRELSGRDLGTRETMGAVRRAFVGDTGWELVPGGWGDGEVGQEGRIEALVEGKYTRAGWYDKR